MRASRRKHLASDAAACRPKLNIGKLSAGAAEYYLEHVARGVEDHYLHAGEAPGAWMGAGAASLGVAGEVSDQQLIDMFAGKHPLSGEVLALARPRHQRLPGFDLTLRALKSVSLLVALSEGEVSREVKVGHEAAVRAALYRLSRVDPPAEPAGRHRWRPCGPRGGSQRQLHRGDRARQGADKGEDRIWFAPLRKLETEGAVKELENTPGAFGRLLLRPDDPSQSHWDVELQRTFPADAASVRGAVEADRMGFLFHGLDPAVAAELRARWAAVSTRSGPLIATDNASHLIDRA